MTIGSILARIPVPIRQQLAAEIVEPEAVEEDGDLAVPIIFDADEEQQALFFSGYCIALLRVAELLDPARQEEWQ